MQYYEWMGKIEEHEGKKYLLVGDCMIQTKLDKIK